MILSTEFAHAMRRARLKQKTLAVLTGKNRATVARWMHGDSPVPEYAWTIVRLTERTQQPAANTPENHNGYRPRSSP